MPLLLTRLVSIDPENPENFKLWARYYKLKSDQLKPAATKENAPEPAQLAYKNATDSLIANYGRFQDATVKVSFTLFTHDGPRHVLGGSIDNLSDKDRTYTLKVDFMDASGAVLTTKEVPVEGVAAKGSKSFRVQVDDKPGIVAFKYAPFPKG